MKTLWTDGYPADGRDTVVLISMPKYGGLSYRLHVLRTEGIKRKPDSSIKTRWAASLAAFFYTGPDGLFPLFDGSIVTLKGAPFGLLVAPPHLMEEFAYVIMMVFHSQLFFDQLRNAFGRPQLRPITRWILRGWTL